MSRKVKSIRGEIVDFDLFAIKEQISNTPKNADVKNRERFIDKKRRRATRNSVNDLVTQQLQNEAIVREALAKQKSMVNQEVKSDTSIMQDDTVVQDVELVSQKIIKK